MPSGQWQAAKEIEQAQAYAEAYYSASNCVAFDRNISKGSNLSEGRKIAHRWLIKRVADCHLNRWIDASLERAEVLPTTLISEEITGLPLCERGWAAVNSILNEWFGDDAKSMFKMKTAAEHFVQSLIALVWNRWRRNIKRDRERILALEERFEATLKPVTSDGVADHLKVTKDLLKKLNVLQEQQLFGETPRGQARSSPRDERRAERRQLPEAKAADLPPRLPKALREAFKTMPTPAEAHAMIVKITEIIEAAESDFELVLAAPTVSWQEGIEQFKDLTIADMQALLALPEATFPFFSLKVPNGQEDLWSVEGRLALEDPNAPDLRPFWHQWVGVTKIMHNMMQWLPTLVLDQVGVGKTISARSRYTSEDTKHAQKHMPLRSGIHVVVCTSGLVDQWIAEIHRCLKSTTFCVFPYTGTYMEKNRKPFWDTVERVRKSRPGLTFIVVTTYLAVAHDTKHCFQVADGKTIKSLGMTEKQGVDKNLTLFGQVITSVVADEVHNVRKPGPRRSALYELLLRAELRIGMTATPIIHSPMVIRGLAHNEYVGPTMAALFGFVDFLRDQLAPYVIHCTPYSVTNDGKPIHNIPPVVEVPVVVKLIDEEMEVQTILAERLAKETHGGNVKDLAVSAQILLGSIGHGAAATLFLPGYTIPKDDFHYEDRPSTKLNALLALLTYHVGCTCAPPAIIEEGVIIEPDESAASEWNVVPGAAPDKIIVYSAFPSLFPIIIAPSAEC
ncbi:hypothetical protein FKP32DRAFT_1602933 [Trametes sanguinea]|nr:hypothetical protein FKP32DRAFT_1602933 [Trametes sanguinea]